MEHLIIVSCFERAQADQLVAPEVVQSKGYNKSVDWYALGVLIFEMLVRLMCNYADMSGWLPTVLH